MATYTVEVEPYATAQLTGRLGTAVVTYRNREYRVALGTSDILECTCNGSARLPMELPDEIRRFAKRQRHALMVAHAKRPGISVKRPTSTP
jgi:hypothetical protein